MDAVHAANFITEKKSEELIDADVAEQYALVHKAGGMGHPEFNDYATLYATDHHLARTAGSDQHSTEMVYGGMVFNRRLADIHDYIRAVLGGEAVELLDGTYNPFTVSDEEN